MMEHSDATLAPMARMPMDGRIVLAPRQLKAHRLRLGLSQEALAEYCFGRRLCVSIASIKRAESGKSILYRTARHLAAAYEVGLETLVSTLPAPTVAAYPHSATAPAHDVAANGYPGDDELAPRSVVVLALPPGVDLTSIQAREAASLAAQFGGMPMAAQGAAWAAVFGLPQAYGSDAARCLECATALAQRIDCGGRPLLVGPGEWRDGRLQCSMSFADAGPAHDAGAKVGVAVSAGSSRIMVERTCCAMVLDQFSFDTADAHGRHPPFALLRPGAAGAARPSRPFIARYAQLQQFKAILDEAQATQCGQLVHVRGVAGIGKSRLVREFHAIARQWEFACHDVAIVDFGAESGAAPGAQLVRELTALPGSGAADEAALLGAWLRAAGLGATQEMPLRALLGLAQSADQAAIFNGMDHAARRRAAVEALQALLLRVAIAQPVLVVIEDIHWADASFREMFALLLPLTQDAAITWVTTSRFNGDPFEEHIRPHCQDMPLTVLDLPPLRTSEAEALALQHGGIDPAQRRMCIERAQGNALFLTQLLLAPPGRSLPDSLRHLVQAQLDRLPSLDRRALRIAAAIGQQFPLALLRQMLDAPDYRPELPERAHLLKPSIDGGGAFVHDLVMHCIYDLITPPQRRHLHQQLAQHYRERDQVLWARHLERAEDDGAPTAYLCAIRERLARHDYALAIELAGQCRRIGYATVDHYALDMLAAEAAARTMRNDEARQGYERARDLAATAQERLDAILGLAAILNVLDRTGEEDELLDAALPTARAIGNEASLARLMYLKGNIRFPKGDFVGGRRFHEQALRHARAGAANNLEALSLSGLGDSLYAEGRMGRAHAVFADCLAICRRYELANVEASNLFMLGTTRIYLGRTGEALDDALASAALGLRVGNRRAEIVSRLTASWVLLSMERLDEARVQVEEGLHLARSMGAARFEPFLGECLARLSFLGGRRSLALSQVGAACEAVERLGMRSFIGPWLQGTLALLSDDPAQRRNALLRGRDMLAQGCVAHNRYRFHVAAAEIALLDGDAAGAAAEMAHLQAATGDDPCAWVEHQVRVTHAYGRWLAEPCDDTRADLYELRRDALRQGYALATPRLDAALSAL